MAKIPDLLTQIDTGVFDATFRRLYGDRVQQARARYAGALQEFEALYGAGDNVSLYSTPGRTEIGGNHTDHQRGVVMAAAVDLDIIAVVAQNTEGFVRVKSRGFRQADSVDLGYLEPSSEEFGSSGAMIRGVAAGIVQRGGRVGGFNAYTTSDVLRGSGLSSSAAFVVCIACIFNHEYNEGRFTPVELGLIGQYAENEFFGKPSGLMDQTACAVGSAITIDFANEDSPVVQKIPFDLARHGYKLVITDTKGSHANLTDEYAAVRSEMERVAAYFKKDVLREVPREEFFAAIPDIRRYTGDRALLRAVHFYEECRRVAVLAESIQADDLERFKATIIESGHSSFEYNQNAYSTKDPASQGVPLGLALSQTVLQGRGAWRLQGGGFAGTIQAFVPEDLLSAYCQTLNGVFGEGSCYPLAVRPDGAVRVTP